MAPLLGDLTGGRGPEVLRAKMPRRMVPAGRTVLQVPSDKACPMEFQHPEEIQDRVELPDLRGSTDIGTLESKTKGCGVDSHIRSFK